MAPKNVYGKKSTHRNAFAVSSIFESSSPERPVEPAADEIKNTIAAVNALSLHDHVVGIPDSSSNDRKRSSQRRRPLGSKQSNQKVDQAQNSTSSATKNSQQYLSIQKHSQKTRTKTKPRTEQAPRSIKLSSEVTPECIEDARVREYLQPITCLSFDPEENSFTESFTAWSDSLEVCFNIVKIAEASFGEVYRLQLKDPHSTFNSSDESVIKLLALQSPPDSHPTPPRKSKKQQEQAHDWLSSVAAVESELKILHRMATVPGFTNFRDVRVVRGRPSKAFAAAWRNWNRCMASKGHETSIFPDPGKKSSYPEQQLWAVIEMQDAGLDLEHVQLADVWSVWDVFWGTALALMRGERDARFEHRDLHLGNVCVRARREEIGTVLPGNGRIKGIGMTRRGIKIGFSGLETTIIDYTVARAEIVDTSGLDEAQEKDILQEVAFFDFSRDENFFNQDASEIYQYEIYRYMRSAAFFSDPLLVGERFDEAAAARTGRTWHGFHPQTNLVWLHFVLHELVQWIESWPSQNMEVCLKNLDAGEDLREAKKMARFLERGLKRIGKVLSIETIPREGMASTEDLIAWALEERWLGREDLV